ncbi:MAG: diacylglycerol/lipid kinase family protein [Bacteroidota bacterium]|jgi:diacylglycerol kinase (ATP)
MNEDRLFVVNPISGGKSKIDFLDFLHSNISVNDEILIWEKSSDAENISHKIKLSKQKTIVAVGGDGTVNLVAKNIINAEKQLGIIPFGSGNGLARHMKIPLQPQKAFHFLASSKPMKIDTGKVNQLLFCCTCGFSFDAAVALKFAGLSSRGLKSYIAAGLEILKAYEPPVFTVRIKQGQTKGNYYILTIANANQYGNNVKIAPHAKIDDGFLELVMIKKPSLPKTMVLISKLLSNQILSSEHVQHTSISTCDISSPKAFAFHLDGEPFAPVHEANIEVCPKSLQILA